MEKIDKHREKINQMVKDEITRLFEKILDYDEVDSGVNKYIMLSGRDIRYLNAGDNATIKFWNDFYNH